MPNAASVFFRDPTTGPVFDPAAAKGVAIAAASYSPSITGTGIDLWVTGVAKGAGSVDVSASNSAGSANNTAPVDAGSGLFTAKFTALLIGTQRDTIALAARLDARNIDRAAFPLEMDSTLAIPPSTRAIVGPAATAFCAGTPDRLVRLRYFQRIYFRSRLSDRGDRVALYDDAGNGREVDLKELERQTRDATAELESTARTDELGYADYRRQFLDIVARGASKLARPFSLQDTTPKRRSAPRRRMRANAAAAVLAPQRAALLSAGPAAMRRAFIPANGGPTIVAYGPVQKPGDRREWQNFFEAWFPKVVLSPVGILFSDRLRFQPAGSVLGEQVYALSLAPGEEVQVRQSVETKRRTVLEDVKDREAEQELSLSSTWSTDLSEAVRESKNEQSTTSLSTTGSSNLEDVGIPVNLGASLAFSGTQADDLTTELSAKESRQTTTTAAARMRSEHKTRVEITNEQSSSFVSTRTVKNANALRAMTCLFHKIYRKERVTLERYRAQLCLRLEVKDPCAATRAAFLEGLRKVDPDNPDLYSGVVPGEVRATYEVTSQDLTGVPGIVSGDDEWDQTFTLKTGNLDLVNLSKQDGGVSVQSDFVLVEAPRVRVESFRWGTQAYSGDASLEEITGKNPAVYWDNDPKSWKVGPKAVLKVWQRTQRFRRPDGSYLARNTNNFHISIETRWAPNSTDMAAYTLDRLNQRQQLIRDFDPADVEALRDVAVANFTGTVLAEAVAQNLSDGPELKDVLQLFDMDGAFVETLPFWATQDGRARYSTLRVALDRLPKVVVASDILVDAITASAAVVYLPIREGLEAEGLALVSGLSDAVTARLIDEIETVRANGLSSIARTWDTMDVVTGPAPVAATAAGAAAWATEWEQQAQGFRVLAQWSELVPTDGVHLEMMVSASTGADEAATDKLAWRRN